MPKLESRRSQSTLRSVAQIGRPPNDPKEEGKIDEDRPVDHPKKSIGPGDPYQNLPTASAPACSLSALQATLNKVVNRFRTGDGERSPETAPMDRFLGLQNQNWEFGGVPSFETPGDPK